MADAPLTDRPSFPEAAGPAGAPGPPWGEERYRSLFTECPVPLWEEDMTGLVARLDALRASGVTDLRAHLAAHPEEVARCVRLIRVVAVNRAALDLYEAPDVPSLLAGLDGIFTAQAYIAFREIVLALAEGKRQFEIETENRTLRGRMLPICLRWSLLPDREGRPTRVLLSVLDLTERRRREETLRRSEERWRGVVETSAAWIWETDASLRHVYTNAFVTTCLGYEPAEFLRANTLDLVHPDDRHLVTELVQRALARKEGWSGVVLRWRHRDGSWRHIESSGSPVFDETGSFAGLRGVDRDVTAGRSAERQLRESEERFKALIESTSDWIWEVDADARYTYASPKVKDLLGYEPQEIIGKTPFDLMEPAEAARVAQLFSEPTRAGKPFVGLVNVNVHKDGRRIVLETSGVPILDAEGRLRGYRGIDRDITERQLLEEERLKTQKLESIGTLAGGIAHDFNNLLQGIFGYIAMAKTSLAQGEPACAMLEQSEKALHLTVSLTSRLLTFSRGGKPLKARLALGPVIENAARFALSGSRSDLRFAAAPDLWAVDADEGQLVQVIQNIVLNADQAMPPGGRVTVAARNLPAAEAATRAGLGRRDYVEITVTDQGTGIPPQDRDRIFDPYFSTKEGGSGLGLATSYSIVRNHAGRIEVHSEVGSGSTFVVVLPAATGVLGIAEPAEAPPPTAPARRSRILLMDDEELVRKVAGELLRSLGHEVELAEHGEAVLRKYREARQAGRPFDLVILDLTIRGGLGGAETMRALLQIDPGARAVVSSGYSDDSVIAAYREHGFRACLKKPYSLEQLRRTLGPLLA